MRQGKGQTKAPVRKAPAKKKAAWSLSDQTEEDLVEWLKGNEFLWLRSTKDYYRKKTAWEDKAKELGVSLTHLQNWWKNIKDWYVKLLKKTSGQATKTMTPRDKWILTNISFYKSKLYFCTCIKSFLI